MAQTVAFALLGAFVYHHLYSNDECLISGKKIKHQPNISDKVMYRVEGCISMR